jgi:hypothetical protein
MYAVIRGWRLQPLEELHNERNRVHATVHAFARQQLRLLALQNHQFTMKRY